MDTVRLTTAQALVRFLENQYICWDDKEQPFVKGKVVLPGHGPVVGLGQAGSQESIRGRTSGDRHMRLSHLQNKASVSKFLP